MSSTQPLQAELSRLINQRDLGAIDCSDAQSLEFTTDFLLASGYWESRSWQQLLWYLQFHQSCFIVLKGEPETELSHIISQYQSGRSFFSILDRTSGRIVNVRFDPSRAHLVVITTGPAASLINPPQNCIKSARLTQ